MKLKKFIIRIVADTTVWADVEVEAKNLKSAHDLVVEKYRNGEISHYEMSDGNHLEWEISE